MIYFDLKSRKSIIDSHYNFLKTEILDESIRNSTLNREMLGFINLNLEKIITGEPKALKNIKRNFLKLRSNRNTKGQKEKVRKIFNYKKFRNKTVNNYDAYDLSKELNIRACLYCNRVYTLTVLKGTKNSDKITRPQFDHFFDKAENPIFGLSIYNLIPSCNICNSTLKGKKKFGLSTHHHPYIDDFTKQYSYKFKPYNVKTILGLKSDLEIDVDIVSSDRIVVNKINKSLEVFKLKEIMTAHSDELMDLFNIRYRFSDRYFEELFRTYRTLGLNIEEVYRTVFGTEYKIDKFSKRPFSKIKRDLLKELNIVK